MTRFLIPLVTLLVGLTLGLGASALAGERTTRVGCNPAVISACSTLSVWCASLKRDHMYEIEDLTVRGIFVFERSACRYWRR
jgi:hypothetical protein